MPNDNIGLSSHFPANRVEGLCEDLVLLRLSGSCICEPCASAIAHFNDKHGLTLYGVLLPGNRVRVTQEKGIRSELESDGLWGVGKDPWWDPSTLGFLSRFLLLSITSVHDEPPTTYGFISRVLEEVCDPGEGVVVAVHDDAFAPTVFPQTGVPVSPWGLHSADSLDGVPIQTCTCASA